MTLMVAAAEHSHPGHVRRVNEDAVVSAAPIYAVADGMGGHNSGDVASEIVATVLAGLGREGPHTEEGVRGALELANVRIQRETPQANGGAGTTVVGLVLVAGESFAFNVGDSRLYLRRGENMTQLSRDHSVVQEMVDSGEIGTEEANTHEQRNVITRAVGIEPELEVDILDLHPAVGDRFLLTSDGLTGELSDERIAEVLGGEGELEDVAATLVDAALANGGRDNISVIVIDILQLSDEGSAETDNSESFAHVPSGDTTERRKRLAATIRNADESGVKAD
jgi:protein phosphatase